MVTTYYVEKKPAPGQEPAALLDELRDLSGYPALKGLRLLNRYDVEGTGRGPFDQRRSDGALRASAGRRCRSCLPSGDTVFAVEYLPGQFDQRADSAAQCIQLMTQGERPTVRTARVYVL